MKTPAISLALLVILVAAVFLTGRGDANAAADFTFVDRADINTLDLNQMSYLQDFRLTYAFREGLFSLKPKTFEPIPAGCESYDVSPDARVYTFHLRRACKWTDSSPVTAHDYVFSWKRMLEEPGDYTSLFYYIASAEAYQKAYTDRAPFDLATLGFVALDDYTLRVTLTDPVAYLIDLMAFPPFYPRNEASMAKFRSFTDGGEMIQNAASASGLDLARATGAQILDSLAKLETQAPFGVATEPAAETTFDKFSQAQQLHFMVAQRRVMFSIDTRYTRPPDVVTNGPFELVTWQFKNKLRLNKSNTYWDSANVALNSIEMVVNENALSQFLQYEAGAVDWLCETPPEIAPKLYADGRPDQHRTPQFGTAFLSLLTSDRFAPSVLNGAKNPMADVRVRRALAMSIDKRFIVEQISRLGEATATTYFPPQTLAGFDLLPGLPYDVAEAKRLLAEAGYPDGRGFPELPVMYATSNKTREKIVQYVATEWRKNLNINCDIQGIEGKVFSTRMTKREYAIAPTGWYGDYPDVSTFTDKYLSTSINNNSAWNNEKYDALCFAATKEADKAKRLKLLQEAEQMIDTEMPIIPLYYYYGSSMYRDNVEGVEANPRNLVVWKAVKVKR